MGCDIHCYAEKLIDGKWVHLTGFENRYEEISVHPYSSRSYRLFSLLADVRNGRGFAGCLTGDRIEPISKPRGLPEDVSDFVREESNEYGEDGHSHSWLLLSELLSHDYNTPIVNIGFVNKYGFEEFMKDGFPSCYSGDCFGNIEKISNEEMRAFIESGKECLDNGKNPYTQIQFSVPQQEMMSDFVNQTLPALCKRSDSENYRDVRIVFWFDN